MRVVWAWAFLDLPDDDLDGQLAFWQRVTRATRSPWRGDQGEFATLLPAEGDPWLKVQRVGSAGGVHLDLEVDDSAAARDLAEGLGARVVEDLGSLVVCRSPGGFGFCLVRARAGGPSRQVRDGEPSLLDQVCLDIPADSYAAELDFWSRLTGWSPPAPAPDESGLLPLTRPAGVPLRLLTQRLGSDDPAGADSEGTNRDVTAHVDLACADRGAQTRLHESWGARVVSVHEGWTVMTAPGGRRYCLTERAPGTGLRP